MFADRRNQKSGDSDGMSSHLRTFSYPFPSACGRWYHAHTGPLGAQV